MDYPDFLQRLHEGISEPSGSGRNKQIITFDKPQQYRECLSYLRKLKPELAGLRQVQPARLIRALIAPLSGGDRLGKYHNGVTVEEDTRMKVHAETAHIPKAEKNLSMPWGVKQVRAYKAWPSSTGNRVRIGVIDTGADFQHPDLRHSLARGINLLNRTMLPYDDNGHGTHIAGTIAASNYDEGMVGVAPRALIHPVKAFDHNGAAYVSDIILGIDWCVLNRVDIINMSFGMKSRSKALLDMVNKAYHNGIVIVASSGNEGKRRSIDYPARYSQTISVGATDKYRRIAPFSNRGQFVDVYAPGEKITSSWIHGKHHEMSGTSMATSHVTGSIALLLSLRPELAPGEIKALLKRTATPLRLRKSAGRSSISTKLGEVDAFRLMQEGTK